MFTTTFDRDLLVNVKRHTIGIVSTAAVLLALAPISLLLCVLWPSVTLPIIGQISFVSFIVAAVTLLVVTAISQDIRG